MWGKSDKNVYKLGRVDWIRPNLEIITSVLGWLPETGDH
jgi:hypothetical protein